MHILLAVLWVSAAAAAPGCNALPTKGESLNNIIISKVTMIAQTTLVRIRGLQQNQLDDAQIRNLNITPSIEGLTSICHYLGVLESELENPPTELLNQIRFDVSSLRGLCHSHAVQMDCTVAARQVRTEGSDTGKLFPDSHLKMTLIAVQGYLQQLLLNKDKLGVC